MIHKILFRPVLNGFSLSEKGFLGELHFLWKTVDFCKAQLSCVLNFMILIIFTVFLVCTKNSSFNWLNNELHYTCLQCDKNLVLHTF